MRISGLWGMGIGICLAAGCGSAGVPEELPQVPAPVAGATTERAQVARIPEEVLPLPREPPSDPSVERTRQDGADLASQINPCGDTPPGAKGRVANRQVIVVADRRLWKSERVVVYRDIAAARAAMEEMRADLTRCAVRPNADGTEVRWLHEPIAIGDEAFFVGGQYVRGQTVLRGHFRGVVARQGRALAIAFDFNRRTELPTREETAEQQRWAGAVATQLRHAAWLRDA